MDKPFVPKTTIRNRRAVFIGAGRPLEVREMLIGAPGPGEALVRVAYSGLCGSELHLLSDPRELEAYVSVQAAPSHTHDAQEGQVLGHEYSGRIEAVGPDVSGWEPGELVSCLPRLPCQRCSRCRADEHTLCEDFWRPTEKAWADFAVVRQAQLRRIPDGVSLRLASLAEPLAHCIQALDVASWRPGESAMVVGAGPIGLLQIALLVASGAKRVFFSEPSEVRHDLAVRLGAVPLLPSDPIGNLKVQTDGVGVDVAFECVGNTNAFAVAYESVRRGGRLVQLGVAPYDMPIPVELRELWLRMVTIIPACGIERTWDRALDWLRSLPVEPIITHDFTLPRINEAVSTARSGAAGKVAIAWSDDPAAGEPPARGGTDLHRRTS